MSESNFILKLVEAGLTADQIKTIKTYFWANGMLNLCSPTVQTLMITGKLNATELVKAAEAKKAEKISKIKEVLG